MQLEGGKKTAADEERQTKMTETLQVPHIKAHMIILLKAFCGTFLTASVQQLHAFPAQPLRLETREWRCHAHELRLWERIWRTKCRFNDFLDSLSLFFLCSREKIKSGFSFAGLKDTHSALYLLANAAIVIYGNGGSRCAGGRAGNHCLGIFR